MKNRNYLITGASSGIGFAIVESLLNEGAQVIAVARRIAESPCLNKLSVRSRLTSIRCDLANFSELEVTMKELMGSKINLDGAVLCHGYGDFGNYEEFSVERIVNLVHANLLSHMLVTRHILPDLKRRGRGDLVLIGSESGVRAGKMGAVYSATKFGINGFAESLRAECASANLRVSVINPGAVDTNFFDHLEFCPGDAHENSIDPVDVSKLVVAILSLPPGTVIDKINLTPQKRVFQKNQ